MLNSPIKISIHYLFFGKTTLETSKLTMWIFQRKFHICDLVSLTILLLRLHWTELSFNQLLSCFFLHANHQPLPVVVITAVNLCPSKKLPHWRLYCHCRQSAATLTGEPDLYPERQDVSTSLFWTAGILNSALKSRSVLGAKEDTANEMIWLVTKEKSSCYNWRHISMYQKWAINFNTLAFICDKMSTCDEFLRFYFMLYIWWNLFYWGYESSFNKCRVMKL